jgi:hypothetical protein
LLFLWQTQTGAAFAIAAAGVGARVILDQTATTRRLDERRRERRATALRAVLPLDLMELTDYTSKCAAIYGDLLARPNQFNIHAPDLPFPPLPEGLASRLTELIEATDPDHTPRAIRGP